MKNLRFHEKLYDLFNRTFVPDGQLELTEFNHPRVAFFGDLPDERVEDETSSHAFSGDFLDMAVTTFQDLEEGLSVRVVESEALSDEQVRVLDHAYGVMVQHYARQAPDKDHFMVPYGLLTLDGHHPAFDDTLFIARDFIATATKRLDAVMKHVFSQKMVDLKKKVEGSGRLLMPAANLNMVRHNQADGTEEFFRPFCNYDLQMGGLMGWGRLEQAVQRYLETETPTQFPQIQLNLAVQLDELGQILDKSLVNILDFETRDTIMNHIQRAKEAYFGAN